jgi:hypothetical protein
MLTASCTTPYDTPFDASLYGDDKRYTPFVVTIVCDKEVWEEFEPISGTYVVHNQSQEPFTLTDGFLPNPQITNASGTWPTSFKADMYYGLLIYPSVIAPGEQRSYSFRICTDPDQGPFGYRMPEGQYTLAYIRSTSDFPAAVKTEPVKIRVVPRGAQ